MPSEDIDKIVQEYKTKNITQAEIAKKYRITKTLVHRLLKEDKTRSEKLRVLKEKEKKELRT